MSEHRYPPPAAPLVDVCTRCGSPFGDAAIVVDGAGHCHFRCQDWEKKRFPFEFELKELRRAYRIFREATAEVRKAGLSLRAIRQRWSAEASYDLWHSCVENLRRLDAKLAQSALEHVRHKRPPSGG